MNGSGSIWYQLGIDNSQLQRDADKSSKIFQGIGNTVDSEGARIDNIVKRLASGIATLGVSLSAGALVKQIASVRGEFQQLEIAFETMLGSKGRADALMSQLVDTAAKTPFDLSGVANGAKQLLAYGTASEEVNDTLIRLGNIASGLSIPLNDMVYLYGTTQVQGRLFTQDVRQFMGRGIPLVQQLAKELGKTEEEINGMVTAGKIGFPEVQRVIQNMTDEGGMFFNLMEKQSASITGQIANMQDAWDMMLNDIGSKSEGVFSSAIDATTSLVENYEKIGKVLLGIVAIYGAYKGAVIALNVVQRLQGAIALQNALAGRTLTVTQGLQAVATRQLTVAQAALNKTMLANPYVLATMAVVGLGYAIWALHDSTTAQERAQEQLNKVMDEARQKKENLESKTNRLIGIINSETKTIYEQISAYRELQGLYPNILANMERATFKTMSATEQQKLLNVAISEFDDANKNAVLNNYKKLQSDLKAAGSNGYKQNDVYSDITKALDISFMKRLGMDGDDLTKMLNETIKLLEKEKKQREENRKEAEFLALPEEEQKKRLQAQLEELKKQETAIDDKIKATGLFNEELSKGDGVLKGWFNNEGKLKNMFAMANPALKSWIDSLNTVRTQIEDIENNLNPKPIATLTEQTKAARETVSLLKQGLVDLRGGKTESANYAKDIEDKAKELKEAEDKLSYLLFGKASSSKSGAGKKDDSAEKRLEAQRRLDETYKQRQIDRLAFDFDMRQKEIDLMDDSFDKRIVQLQLNQEKEQQIINEFKKKIAKEQYQESKDQYIKKHGNDNKFETYYSKLTPEDLAQSMPVGLTPADVEDRVKMMTDAAKNAQESGLEEVNKDLSRMLQDQRLIFASNLDQQLADLDTYYAEQLIKVGTNEEAITLLKANHARERKEAEIKDKLENIDYSEQLNQERLAGMESIGMTELVEEKKLEITKRYLQQRIEALQELADAGDEDAKRQMQLYEASLQKLDTRKPAKSLKSLADKAIFDTIKKGFEKAGDSAEEAENKTTSLLGSISQKAGMVANITNELKSMFGGLNEDLDMAMETVGNIATGFATGGIVGGAMAVVGEGMKLFSKASEAAARHQKALKEIADDRLASQRAYNLLLLEQNLLLKEATTIFGEKEIYKAANSIKVYRDAIDDLKDAMRGNAPTAPTGGIFATLDKKRYEKELSDYNKGIKGLADAQIVTGHKKTGLFGWGKGKDTHSSILDEYDDVLTKEGELNVSRIENILATRKMSDETKTYLKNLIDLQQIAEQAQEALRSYLQETFGSLGAGAIDSIVDSIKNGTDAWVEFGKVGASVLEKLGEQIAYELFFADKFKKLQDDLEKVYGSGKSSEQITKESMDLVGKYYENIGSDMELAQSWLEDWRKQAKKQDFDLWGNGSSQQSASKGGFETMSQDTGKALEGRFTALQMSGISIDTNIKNLCTIEQESLQHIKLFGVQFQEMRNISLKSMGHLENIEKYTKCIPVMANDMSELKQNLINL